MKTNTSQQSGSEPTPFAARIIRDKEPENLEFPFSSLNSAITPTEQFFIRSHFSVPKLDLQSYRLKVEGHIERALEFTYDELLKMPSTKVAATLECAGNSRIFLSPKVSGLQWELGAVSNAEWIGVSLAEILKRAGTKAGAKEIILEGADSGAIKKEPTSPGKITYARSIPLKKAMQPEVILAHTMNGEPLLPAHGFPFRAVIPGWYGMASVKWIKRIAVSDTPFSGYWQTLDYTYWETRNGLPIELLPVNEIEVKAEIARPGLYEVLPADSVYRMHGAAWTGESEIAKVEVSTDDGKNWTLAQLLGKSVKYAWRLWEYHWKTPTTPGRYTIMARATDTLGHTQPMERDPYRGSYVVTHVQPILVEVRKMAAQTSEGYNI